MINFDAAHKAVHYPPDRRFRIRLRPSVVGAVLVLVGLPVLIAWGQAAVFGLPYIQPVLPYSQSSATGPHGFPVWVRYCHFFNFLFLTMLIRSGLSILMDHPRLYFNNHCTPGTEWIRLSPLTVPKDRLWTAKDDARYISPVAALPGYRHTIGVARSWHFLNVYGFIITGLIFVGLLFSTTQWQRLVPTSGTVFVQAWSTFVHYANFHFPPEPNGYYGYNALQQLTYFGMVFVMGPLSIATGLAMSPALVNHFSSVRWPADRPIYSFRSDARLRHLHRRPRDARGADRIHAKHESHRDRHRRTHALGMILGFVGIGVVILCWIVAHYVSWKCPRACSTRSGRSRSRCCSRPSIGCFRASTIGSTRSRRISGPTARCLCAKTGRDSRRIAFRDYRLQVCGMVENPVELSISELRARSACTRSSPCTTASKAGRALRNGAASR